MGEGRRRWRPSQKDVFRSTMEKKTNGGGVIGFRRVFQRKLFGFFELRRKNIQRNQIPIVLLLQRANFVFLFSSRGVKTFTYNVLA